MNGHHPNFPFRWTVSWSDLPKAKAHLAVNRYGPTVIIDEGNFAHIDCNNITDLVQLAIEFPRQTLAKPSGQGLSDSDWA